MALTTRINWAQMVLSDRKLGPIKPNSGLFFFFFFKDPEDRKLIRRVIDKERKERIAREILNRYGKERVW